MFWASVLMLMLILLPITFLSLALDTYIPASERRAMGILLESSTSEAEEAF